MSEPAVAIITRTKDRPILLRRAIDSVLSQHYRDWVHVIVNDGGDPAPVDALLASHESAYEGRLIRVDNPQSLGMEAASNEGIAASASKYLVIHDDDDSWHPAFLERMTALLAESQPPVAGAICHTVLVREAIEGDAVSLLRQEDFNTDLHAVPLSQMAVRNMFPPISFLFERAALEAVGPYRDTLRVLGDWDFNLRFLRRYDIAVLPEKLAFWHHRAAAKTETYANSSMERGAVDHARFDVSIRNELLRRDLDAGKIDLGLLVNLAGASTPIVPGRLIEERAAPALRAALDEARLKAHAAETEAARLRPVIDRLTGELATVQAQLLDLNRRIAMLHASTSWKITAPMRWGVRLVKRLMGKR